jgi:hypothetical protein
MSIVSHIFPSLIFSEGEEEVDHDNKDNAVNDAEDTANNDNGVDNDNEDDKTIILPKEKPAAAKKTAAKKQNKDDEIMHLPAPKLPTISNFSIKAEDPFTVSYYADGMNNYANVVFHVNKTMEYGEYEVQVARDGRLISFVHVIHARLFEKKI